MQTRGFSYFLLQLFFVVLQNNEDIQHKVIVHDAFGKGFIKSVKVGLSVLCSKKKSFFAQGKDLETLKV